MCESIVHFQYGCTTSDLLERITPFSKTAGALEWLVTFYALSIIVDHDRTSVLTVGVRAASYVVLMNYIVAQLQLG